MKILAFLQNMWVRDPDGVKAMLGRNQDPARRERVHRRLIHYALFAGCLTGRRLKAAFGEECCSRIVWEEASREIGGYGSSFFPPDIEHMKVRIAEEKPSVVILFGAANHKTHRLLAKDGDGILYLKAPHPAARGPEVPQALKAIALRLDRRNELLEANLP